MRTTRAILVCPGRGGYSLDELWLERRPQPDAAMAAWREAIAALDAVRSARSAPPLASVVSASGARSGSELPPDVVSALIFAAGAADLGLVAEAERAGALRVVAVAGLSLGFYTALFASGALALEDAALLVDTMGALQVEHGPVGGQLVYPGCADEDWRPDPAREAAVQAALGAATAAGAVAARSIRLGGYEVLGADDAGLRALEAALPREARKGGITYPMRLAGHSAFHTPLMEPIAAAARERLIDLGFRAPHRALVDGRGAIFRPRSADPGALFDYTLGAQVTRPYDFTRSLRVALREHAPGRILAIGPGDTLGGPIGQTLVREGWAGIRDREAFKARQAGPEPLLLSLGRSGDRERLLAGMGAAAADVVT